MNEVIRWEDISDEENLTVEQLAKYLNVSVSLLNTARMQRDKGPEFWKLGGAVRYQVGAVRRWIKENTQASTRTGFVYDLNDLPESEEIESWLT